MAPSEFCLQTASNFVYRQRGLLWIFVPPSWVLPTSPHEFKALPVIPDPISGMPFDYELDGNKAMIRTMDPTDKSSRLSYELTISAG